MPETPVELEETRDQSKSKKAGAKERDRHVRKCHQKAGILITAQGFPT